MQTQSFQDKDEEPSHANQMLEDSHHRVDSTKAQMLRSFDNIAVRSVRVPSWSTCNRFLKRTLFFLLPTFIQTRLRSELAQVTRLYPTSYLDGMRGVAALAVVIFHMSLGDHSPDFAFGEDGEHWDLMRLPFIRALYNGNAMVSIFFVVSGYALSYKPVKLMRSKRWNELLNGLSSAVFRRGIRLFMPCAIWMLFVAVTVYLGAYDWTRDLAEDRTRLGGPREAHMRRMGTFSGQLYDWACQVFKLIAPFTFRAGKVNLDRHLWTIPIEFRSSIILYVTQLGVSRLRSTIRVIVLILLIIGCVSKDRWEMVLFYGGFLLAEMDFRRNATSASPLSKYQPRSYRYDGSWIWFVVFLIGLYLCGQPGSQSMTVHTPGWDILNALIPACFVDQKRYWLGWGALMIVWAVSNNPSLQKIFTSGFAQYLGKISFALYIVHGWVIHVFGYKLMELLWDKFGYDTKLRKESSFVITTVVVMSMAIWLGDIVTRVADTPSVSFAKWLEGRWIVQDEDESQYIALPQ